MYTRNIPGHDGTWIFPAQRLFRRRRRQRRHRPADCLGTYLLALPTYLITYQQPTTKTHCCSYKNIVFRINNIYKYTICSEKTVFFIYKHGFTRKNVDLCRLFCAAWAHGSASPRAPQAATQTTQ